MNTEDLQAKYKFYPTNGYVSKLTASLVYKMSKEGRIKVLPELIRSLYDAVDREKNTSRAVANQRYNSDYLYYDTLTDLTLALLDRDFREAQKCVDKVQEYLIDRATRKSPFFRYQKKEDTRIATIADMLEEEGWEARTLTKDRAYFIYEDKYSDYAVSADADYGAYIKENDDTVWEGSLEEFIDNAVINDHSIIIGNKVII